MSPPFGVDWGVWIGGAIAIGIASIGCMWKFAHWKGGLDQWKEGVDEWKNEVKDMLNNLQEAVSVIKEEVVSIKAAYEKDATTTRKGKKSMVQRRSPLVPAQEAVDILKDLNIISNVDAKSSYIREEVEKRSRTLLYSDIEDEEERFIAAAPGVIHTLIKKGTIEEKKIDEAMDKLEEVFPGVSYYGVLLLIAAYILEKGREKGFTAKPAMIYSQLYMAGAGDRDELLASFDGDVEKAIKSLELSIRSLEEIGAKEELAEKKFLLALIYHYDRRLDEAEKEYREAIRINPDDAYAHYDLGVLLYDAGRKEEAEEEYRDALRIEPDDAYAHYNLGILLYDLGRPKEAEEEYRDALRIESDFADAHINLGVLLYDLGRPKEAEEEYRDALRIEPDYAEAHYNLGNLLKNARRKEEAEVEYREALRLKPDYAEAHISIGNLLADLERTEEAEAEYWEARRLKPDDAYAHYNLGILYSETGKKEAAKKELEIAKSLFEAQGREEYAKKAEALLQSL